MLCVLVITTSTDIMAATITECVRTTNCTADARVDPDSAAGGSWCLHFAATRPKTFVTENAQWYVCGAPLHFAALLGYFSVRYGLPSPALPSVRSHAKIPFNVRCSRWCVIIVVGAPVLL